MPLGHFFHDLSLKVSFSLKKSVKIACFPQKVSKSHFFQKIRPKIVEKPDKRERKDKKILFRPIN